MGIKIFGVFCFSLAFCFMSANAAQAKPSFEQWLEYLKAEAYTQGVRPATLDRVFPQITLDNEVMDLDARQPEKKKTFAEYIRGALPASRIKLARQMFADNRALLNQVGDAYGIPAELIVALWGIESSFGENMGDFSVLDSRFLSRICG